jgi:MFS family permease
MSNNDSKKNFRLHPNVWILTIASLLTDMSSEMLTNLIPLFLFDVLGVKTATIGLIDGIAETTASLMKVYSGSLSDRLQNRKFLTVAGYTISTLAKPFLYLANAWGWVLGVRFADRLGKGVRTAPRDALLAGSVQAEKRGLAFGFHRAGDTAGAFLGLAISAIIIWLSQSANQILQRHTFQNIVIISVIPAILAVLVLVVGLREMEIKSSQQSPTTSSLGWKELDKRFKIFLFIMVIFTLGNSSDSFIILRGQERGLNLLQILGMLMTFNAIYASLSSPAGWLSDKIGRVSLILIGWSVYAATYLGLAIAKAGYQIWILFGFYGIYYALTEGVAKALVADLVPAGQRGTAYGYYNAAIGFSALPASVIAGVLWQGIAQWNGFGASAPFIFGAIMAFSAGLLFLFFKGIASQDNLKRQ